MSSDWRSRHNPWLIAFSVLLTTFMEVLDTSIANVSLPHIAGNLSASIDEATWVLTSYLVANAVILPAAGWLSSRFGRKNYLAFSAGMFTLASALCGLAHTLPQLILARVLQGLGGGGLQPLSQAVLLETFPPEERGEAMAAYGMGIVVAPIIGPILGGWITDNYSWRWIFYINIPIGALGLLMQEMYLEDPPYLRAARAVTIDAIGFGLMALGIGTLQIVLDKGQEADWFASTWVCWSSAVAVLSLAGFVLWELRQKEPIVHLRLLLNRNFATSVVLISCLGAILYGTTAILPIFMQHLLGYTAFRSGLAMTPRGIGSFFSMMIMGWLIRKINSRTLILIGFAGVAATCWILSHLSLNITPSNVSWPLVFNGLSMGFIFVPLTTLSVATLRREEIFQSTPIYAVMRNIGASLGISIMVALQIRSAQTHQTVLAAHVTSSSPVLRHYVQSAVHALTSLPASMAAMAARGLVYRDVLQQALLLSYMDVFRWLALAAVLVSPFVILFQEKAGRRRQEIVVD